MAIFVVLTPMDSELTGADAYAPFSNVRNAWKHPEEPAFCTLAKRGIGLIAPDPRKDCDTPFNFSGMWSRPGNNKLQQPLPPSHAPWMITQALIGVDAPLSHLAESSVAVPYGLPDNIPGDLGLQIPFGFYSLRLVG